MAKVPKKKKDVEAKEKREEAVRVISERMSGLKQMIDAVKEDGGVSKRGALGIEQICPGLLTETHHINGFTETASKTNYLFTIDQVTKRIEELQDERDALVEADNPLDEASDELVEASEVSESITALEQIAISMASQHNRLINIDHVMKSRLALEKVSKELDVSIESLIPSMDKFNNDDTAQQAVHASLEGIWATIQEQMKKFWEWIKGVFQKIFAWFENAEPEGRIQKLDTFIEKFKSDAGSYEIELQGTDMERLSVGGQLSNTLATEFNHFKTLAVSLKSLEPTVNKASNDAIQAVHARIKANGVEGLKDFIDNTEVMVMNAGTTFDPNILGKSSGKIDKEANLWNMHFLGGFMIKANLNGNGKVIKYETAKSEVKEQAARKYTVHGADAVKIANVLKELIEIGISKKGQDEVKQSEKILSSLNKLSDSFKSQMKDLYTKAETDPAVKSALAASDKFERDCAKRAAELSMTRAAFYRHIEGMEKYLMKLFERAKSGKAKEEKKEDNEKK